MRAIAPCATRSGSLAPNRRPALTRRARVAAPRAEPGESFGEVGGEGVVGVNPATDGAAGRAPPTAVDGNAGDVGRRADRPGGGLPRRPEPPTP